MIPDQLLEIVAVAQPWLRGAAAAGLLFWILLVLDGKRWWPSQWSLHLDTAATQTHPETIGEVCVVVPARNEASMLPRTLPRLIKQADWYRRLVVVDDRSGDQTASVARRLGPGSEAQNKLAVIQIDEDPGNESGKVRALLAGVEEANRDWRGDPTQQWYLFTDADVLHTTSSLARLITKAHAGNFDLVSVMVRLRARSFWEWLLIPPFVYFFHLLYPFRRASDPGSRVAAAAGGCILVRRSALEEAAALDAARGRAIDDVAIGRAVKRSGARCWLGIDPDMRSLRTYDAAGQISDAVARTAFEQLRSSYLLVLVTILGLALLFVAPPLLMVWGVVTRDLWLVVGAAATVLLQAISFLPVVQYLKVPSGFAITLPIASLFYGWMTLRSAGRHLTGRRFAWRPSVSVTPGDD